MAIFALEIMPYISSSIIIQLMTTVSPTLEQLKKEGEAGRKQINQYTRYGTVMLAAVQAYCHCHWPRTVGRGGDRAGTVFPAFHCNYAHRRDDVPDVAG